MGPKSIITLIVILIAVVLLGCFSQGIIGKNEATNWQIKQSLGGKVTIQDKPGYYIKAFATVTTYPRYISKQWNDVAGEGEATVQSIRTTFNDGGTAQISTDIRYATPTSEDQRKTFHQQFSGNIENATIAVKSHLTNCIKASGPLMSASENQSARKAEFTQLVENQTVDGLYAMERIEKTIDVIQTPDEIAKGRAPRKEAVVATKLVLNEGGLPKVAKTSPLKTYGITVLQFSITETKYDPETLEQFKAKKASFLAAEQSKADKIKFAQAEMSTVAEYAQRIAEEKGKADMEKMKQVIDAERDKELAEIDAEKKVTVASFAKEEAEEVKLRALVEANQMLEVAELKALAAEEEKKAIIALAEGKEKAIQLSGAITEREEVLATIAAERDVQISKNIMGMNVPTTMFLGGSGEGGGQTDYFNNLLGYVISKEAGLIPKSSTPVAPSVK